MRFDVAAVRNCLKSFDFQTLFREHLGWDNHQGRLDVCVDGNTVGLTAVAQKRGFVAFICPTIPDRATRLKIDHRVTKSVREHFVIYADKPAGQQVWHWVRREPGKPLASRDHRFDASQSGAPLIQRLNQIAVSLDEEEKITVVDVAGRARAAFDVDRVTKRFYDRFKAEHAAFLKLIKGIKSDEDLQWYTSLMLNRLMFVYFIQRKGFLDGDADYLRNRLAMVRKIKGKDKFHTFYRYFLLRLFHEGLGKSPDERKLDPTLEKLLGKVPFLNGGFFEIHELEERWDAIDIPDGAFEKLFDFFDQYSWHLDERPLRADNEINPDVVGYIFEKYVNQKQMGAYYTKEDITEYISKNTVIPFLIDAARKKCAIAFKPDSALWRLLRDDPDRYIYPAVRHGVVREDGSVVPESELPDFVLKGMRDPKARMFDKRYNLEQAPAGDPIRLVTETWREYVNRRNRCLEIREKLRRGEVHEINDLITLNLDLWQFARDAIAGCEGPELLRAFWHAIEKITVLDPTCGSGAFLFAALRILETLYGDCLERMERFVEELAGKKHHPEQFSDFKKVLDQIAKHPNERYFILKSIIINNLFGVDIMEEAVEICKLRLFLKLVAQVETVEQIEPLPDIDFNIGAGNTLVGFASLEEVRKSQEGKLAFAADEVKRIEEEAELVDRAFQQFRAQQTTHGGRVTHWDKRDLRSRLEKLTAQLDRFLASEYGVNLEKPKDFEAWKASHQAFHWFAEFYGIMRAGGFDVIIGNPPYVSYTKVRHIYALPPKQFQTESSGNLYAFVMERSLSSLGTETRRFGMIVPVSLVSGESYKAIAALTFGDVFHVSTYFNRPGKLFQGVEQRLAIVLSACGHGGGYSTDYQHWYEEERPRLITCLRYTTALRHGSRAIPFKIGTRSGRAILEKILRHSGSVRMWEKTGNYGCWFHDGPTYWIRVLPFEPNKGMKSNRSNHYHRISAATEDDTFAMAALLSSGTFYFFFKTISNCRDLGTKELDEFPIGSMGHDVKAALSSHGRALEKRVRETAKRCSRVYPSGTVSYYEYYPAEAKDIIDKVDCTLARHYGFTDEELDFIINYDIKYRMGGDAAEDEE